MADAINRLFPTTQELDEGINRLLAANLITKQRDGFMLTELAHTTIGKITKPRIGILDLWRKLDKLLSCPCCGPNLKTVRRRVTISKTDVNKAAKAYHEMVEALTGIK
jgi:hypothetical protein